MKKYLFLYAVLTTALLVAGYGRHRSETRRHAENRAALSSRIEHFRTRLGEEAAAVQALRLRCEEFELLRAADAERIRALGFKLRRLEAVSATATATDVTFRAPLSDPLVRRDTSLFRNHPALIRRDTASLRVRLPDAAVTALRPLPAGAARRFRWADAWISVEGVVTADSIACRVESVDTLRQIVHRVPRRFLFIRWGTKAIRQQIVSSNPHTRIVYTEYVKFER